MHFWLVLVKAFCHKKWIQTYIQLTCLLILLTYIMFFRSLKMDCWTELLFSVFLRRPQSKRYSLVVCMCYSYNYYKWLTNFIYLLIIKSIDKQKRWELLSHLQEIDYESSENKVFQNFPSITLKSQSPCPWVWCALPL